MFFTLTWITNSRAEKYDKKIGVSFVMTPSELIRFQSVQDGVSGSYIASWVLNVFSLIGNLTVTFLLLALNRDLI